LYLGDRLDTDILGANRAGMASALVLTGIDGPKQVLAADSDSRPTYLLGDLRELFEPYATPVETAEQGGRVFTAGTARVRLEGNAVRIEDEGESDIEVLRAGTAAVWGAGVPIYALDVDPGLYS
jgi:ribonucleotide monophosphatase NagD (HAD superfamily)